MSISKHCKFLLAMIWFFTALPLGVQAQDKDAKPADKPAEAAAAPAPKEESSVTDHSIKLGSQTIPYKATAATILLKNEKDEPTALLYSTAYTRSDVKDPGMRPIAFVYNGGPGSASVWLHMGAFSPKRVVTANADATPPAPYKLTDNANCLLDKTDLVFVDPVGTGFSHAVGKAAGQGFLGRGPGRQVARAIHQYLYQPQQSMEFAEVFDWGKLRNLSLRRAFELFTVARWHGFQRHRSRFLRFSTSERFPSIQAKTCLTSFICPATRRRRGITRC